MKTPVKWIIVCIYTIVLFVVTPYLPQLIQAASARWSKSGVSGFVLGVEIAISLIIIILGVYFLIQKRKKSIVFVASIGCIFLLSFAIYQFIPNPYEFIHLPEYAVLSMLIIWTLDKKKVENNRTQDKKNQKLKIIKSSYLLSACITGIMGTIDEIYQHFLPTRHFTWYDILLNILGGILGLLIFWGIMRNKIPGPVKKLGQI